MPSASTANGQHSPPSQSLCHSNEVDARPDSSQQPSAAVPPTTDTLTPSSSVDLLTSANDSSSLHSQADPSSPSPSPSPSSVSISISDELVVDEERRRKSSVDEGCDSAYDSSPVTPLGLCPLTLSPDDFPLSSSSSPLSSSFPRVRVPLSSVVTSLTQKWSRWGALKRDPQEGKRWLDRAKLASTAASTVVSQLENQFLGHSDGGGQRRSSDESSDVKSAGRSSSRPARSRHEGADNGYFSGYANTPISSPSQLTQTQTQQVGPHSFFAGVAQAISPKLSLAQQHFTPTSTSQAQPSHGGGAANVARTSIARSVSHEQFLTDGKARDSLALPDLHRRSSSGSGSGSGEEGSHHHLAHHLGHGHHGWMAQGFWKRSQGTVHSEVSAN